MTDEPKSLLDESVPKLEAALPAIDDLDVIQAMIDVEQSEAGHRRSTALAALEKRAEELAGNPDTGGVATEAVDVDGYWPQVLQGDLSSIQRKIEDVTTERDLDQMAALESAGRKRAGVFIALNKRRRAIEPPEKRTGKVKPPVWLDDDGKVHCLNDVKLVGDLVMYPEQGFAAQLYAAQLPEHTGFYKAHLSLLNGMPIGGTMGAYLDRVYAEDEK